MPPNPPKKPSLWLKEDDYLRCHRAFRRASDERDVIQQWMAQSAWLHFHPQEEPRLLSIGCGSGEMDMPWMLQLARRGRPFSYQALDPNTRSLETLRAEAAAVPAENFLTLHPRKFEDFETAERFDRIVFMHSLYHFPDRQGAVAKAAALLAPGGRLLVCVSDDDGLPACKAALYRRVTMPAQSQTTPGSDLRAILKSLPFTCPVTLHSAAARIEVTDCFSGAEDGISLLDFLFLCRFSQLDAGQQSAALTELEAHSVPAGGRRFLHQTLLFAEIGPV